MVSRDNYKNSYRKRKRSYNLLIDSHGNSLAGRGSEKKYRKFLQKKYRVLLLEREKKREKCKGMIRYRL